MKAYRQRRDIVINILIALDGGKQSLYSLAAL
jgi:hypothetical protein